jgi:hypothetical protein
MYQGRAQAVARALGWFSIGLGVAELLAPRVMARTTGLEGRERLLQVYGAREIAAGLAILLFSEKVGAWSRVAGDALDIATLASARNAKSAASLTAVAGVTALDVYTAAALRERPRPYFDYSSRSGFRRSATEMRGAAAGKVKEKRSLAA